MIELQHTGTVEDIQDWDLGLITNSQDVLSALEMIGVGRDHPSFEDVYWSLFYDSAEVSTGSMEILFVVQGLFPSFEKDVYRILHGSSQEEIDAQRAETPKLLAAYRSESSDA